MTELEKILQKASREENNGEFFAAHHSYKAALEIARKANDSVNIKRCKKKTLETGRRSTESFKRISAEINIPVKETNKLITAITSSGLNESLRNIGVSPNLFPRSKNIKEFSEKNIPIFYQFARLSKISEQGHIIQGGDDASHSWFLENYGRTQGLILNLYVAPIFKKLMDEQNLDKTKIISYFQETGIFPPEHLYFISVGLDRYFEKDYVSAMHILIPRFESFFMFASGKLGIDITGLNRSKEISTGNKTLSSNLLQSPEFKNIWGESLCDQIDFILFEPLGYKLRHKVAHGDATKEECNFELTSLIVQLFLAMAARIGVKQSD